MIRAIYLYGFRLEMVGIITTIWDNVQSARKLTIYLHKSNIFLIPTVKKNCGTEVKIPKMKIIYALIKIKMKHRETKILNYFQSAT